MASATSSSLTVTMSSSHASTRGSREPTGLLDRDPVGQRRDRPSDHGLVGVRGAPFDLHADHADLGVGPLQCDRHAAGQPAAADGDDHAPEIRDVLQQLEPERGLPGDDGRIIEGVDEGHPLLGRTHVRGRGDGRVDGLPALAHRGAIRAGGLRLGDRGALGDEDLAPHAEVPGGIGDGLGVIAGAAGHDASSDRRSEIVQLRQRALILNEPVLCRLSALRMIRPPTRAPIVVLETTGVCFTTPRPATLACSISASSIVMMSARSS